MTENYITKVKNQFKSSTYYVFWGTATFVVVAGQIYVGTGYRQMSKSLDAWFDKTISIMIPVSYTHLTLPTSDLV